jgi:hypothetical protein
MQKLVDIQSQVVKIGTVQLDIKVWAEVDTNKVIKVEYQEVTNNG